MSSRQTQRWFPVAIVAGILALVTFGVYKKNIQSANAEENHPVVMMETNKGNIVLELDAEKAPVTVKNFMWYVDNKFYDGLTFHRVVPDFMIQGGGYTVDKVQKTGNPPIKNEAENGLKNLKYTIAMARTGEINSATSQFFINLKDNDFLNNGVRDFGYCVFGKVIQGTEVVDAIGKVTTADSGGAFAAAPVDPVIITKAYRMAPDEVQEMMKDKEKS